MTLLRDTFRVPSGLGAEPIMILADLNVIPHHSLAFRSVIDVGGLADCMAVVAEASAKERPSTSFAHAGTGSRIDAVFANRIAKHSLCDVDAEQVHTLVEDAWMPRSSRCTNWVRSQHESSLKLFFRRTHSCNH